MCLTFGAVGEVRRSSRAIHTVLKWPQPSFFTTIYRSAKTSPSWVKSRGRKDRERATDVKKRKLTETIQHAGKTENTESIRRKNL